jgi:ABC-type proline/glycine betaine transport system permease subunit
MNFLSQKFPTTIRINIGTSIDEAIKAFSRNHQATLSGIKNAVLFVLNSIESLLAFIPWWVYIILLVFLGYKVSKKITTGLLYGLMIFAVGAFGLWEMMIQTLSIIIVSVCMSLLIGFPAGILISTKTRVNTFAKPILDFCQTIPSMVYLIPGAMLFSTGKMPAVIATVIYSIVPMIRMTSHGIRNVDKEVIEAAASFGSTKLQSLVKVEIPQAMPTIMTGVNQTIMMAMSMVVTCALVGANGLGMEIFVATNRTEMGRALVSGMSIVFIAIILDRITQGIVTRQEAGEK